MIAKNVAFEKVSLIIVLEWLVFINIWVVVLHVWLTDSRVASEGLVQGANPIRCVMKGCAHHQTCLEAAPRGSRGGLEPSLQSYPILFFQRVFLGNLKANSRNLGSADPL